MLNPYLKQDRPTCLLCKHTGIIEVACNKISTVAPLTLRQTECIHFIFLLFTLHKNVLLT